MESGKKARMVTFGKWRSFYLKVGFLKKPMGYSSLPFFHPKIEKGLKKRERERERVGERERVESRRKRKEKPMGVSFILQA